MPDFISAIETIDKFIGITKELAKLPALALPQYQDAASDFYEISQKILKSNENVARWLHKFRYFLFGEPTAQIEFQNLVSDYKSMKTGPGFQQLKYSCSDISNIYHKNISSKIGNWFSNKVKREEAEGIFMRLAEADDDMVAFLYDEVTNKLDAFIDKVDHEIDMGNLADLEEIRLEFKRDSKEITQELERLSNELSDLVIRFANIAKRPITLG